MKRSPHTLCAALSLCSWLVSEARTERGFWLARLAILSLRLLLDDPMARVILFSLDANPLSPPQPFPPSPPSLLSSSSSSSSAAAGSDRHHHGYPPHASSSSFTSSSPSSSASSEVPHPPLISLPLWSKVSCNTAS